MSEIPPDESNLSNPEQRKRSSSEHTAADPKRSRVMQSGSAEPSSGSSLSLQRHTETERVKTKRRTGTRGELGHIYETKLLMFVLYRALKWKYVFELDTNVDGVGAFDDIVFTYKESDGKEQGFYMQAKHNEREDHDNKITCADLLGKGKNSDKYALYKYFIDYINLNEKDTKYKDFIIYTNVDFKCSKADDGSRILGYIRKEEYFIFIKLDLTEHPLLQNIFIINSENEVKCPAFYKFSYRNKQNEHDETRLLDILESNFKSMNEKKKKDPKYRITDRSKLKRFLDSLIFAVDQLDEEMLGKQIKEEIKEDYLRKEINLTNKEDDFIFDYALNKVCRWKLCKEAYPFTEANKVFSEGKNKLENFQVLYPTLSYENKLNSFNLKFKEMHIELNKFISAGEKLWHISTEAPLLNSLVIYQALNEEIFYAQSSQKHAKGRINYANHDHHLFLLLEIYLMDMNVFFLLLRRWGNLY